MTFYYFWGITLSLLYWWSLARWPIHCIKRCSIVTYDNCSYLEDLRAVSLLAKVTGPWSLFLRTWAGALARPEVVSSPRPLVKGRRIAFHEPLPLYPLHTALWQLHNVIHVTPEEGCPRSFDLWMYAFHFASGTVLCVSAFNLQIVNFRRPYGR